VDDWVVEGTAKDPDTERLKVSWLDGLARRLQAGEIRAGLEPANELRAQTLKSVEDRLPPGQPRGQPIRFQRTSATQPGIFDVAGRPPPTRLAMTLVASIGWWFRQSTVRCR